MRTRVHAYGVRTNLCLGLKTFNVCRDDNFQSSNVNMAAFVNALVRTCCEYSDVGHTPLDALHL
jgi:hypothetical protein